jgi:methylated-DNA-protein-cysteine methyltransferase-like protein
MLQPTLKQEVFRIVKKIPQGKVANFGLIAEVVGSGARTVGWIMSGMTKEEWSVIPWHRVVAKNGFISSLKLGEKGMLQKELLIQEGYDLIGDRVDMEKHLISYTELQEID